MTKGEFKLRALLAMCSNPEYVDGMSLQVKSMIENAEKLANNAKEIAYFEDASETLNGNLEATCKAIEEISMHDGKLDFLNDTLKGIEKSLDYLNELLSKAMQDDDEHESLE